MWLIFRRLLLLIIVICPAYSKGQLFNNKQLSHKLDSLSSVNQFSGTVLVGIDSAIIFKHSAGYENRDEGKKISDHTVFELASLSKQFTAALILKLIEEEKLSLDDHIGKHLPWYTTPYKNKVSIHQLLSHQSGIPNYTQIDDWPEISGKAYGGKDFVELFSDLPLEFEPGTSFSYSNSNYYLLGLIAEEVTGESFGTLLQQHIWEPVDMKRSGTKMNLPIDLAKGYERLSNGVIEKAPYQDYSTAFSVSGLYSSPRDLFRWSRALQGDEFMSNFLKKRMFSPNAKGYGYGLVISEVVPDNLSGLLKNPFSQTEVKQDKEESVQIIWHWGSNPGYNTLFLVIPEIKGTIIILENLTQLGTEEQTQVFHIAEDILKETLINQHKEE